MSDTARIIVGVIFLAAIWALAWIFCRAAARKEKTMNDVLSESWRRDQARKGEEEDSTKTLPIEEEK